MGLSLWSRFVLSEGARLYMSKRYRWLFSCPVAVLTLSVGFISGPLRAADAPKAPIDPDFLPLPQPVKPIVKQPPRPFTWEAVPAALPASIKIYSGDAINNDGFVVHAWFADIDFSFGIIMA